jgi:hypothetical protein
MYVIVPIHNLVCLHNYRLVPILWVMGGQPKIGVIMIMCDPKYHYCGPWGSYPRLGNFTGQKLSLKLKGNHY